MEEVWVGEVRVGSRVRIWFIDVLPEDLVRNPSLSSILQPLPQGVFARSVCLVSGAGASTKKGSRPLRNSLTTGIDPPEKPHRQAIWCQGNKAGS